MRTSSGLLRLRRLALGCAALWLVAAAAHAQSAGDLLTPAERALILSALAAGGQVAQPNAGDAALVSAVVRYAGVELGQRVDPSAVDKLWALEPPKRNVAGEFAAARQAGRLGEWLQGLSPPYPAYRNLQVAARRYRAAADGGGWDVLAPGPVLKEGARGPAVTALRQRLAMEGFTSAAPREPELFDAALRKALAEFQRRHGLEPDGTLSAAARATLNVSAEDRADQLEANLERWRWLPHTLPGDRLEIDIAGQQATLFRGGAPALTQRIIVGDPKHRTPMFASTLEAVVFNPPWNVPASIAQAELLPKEARNPGYLAKNDFIWVDGHLQQRAGPKSALGLVKFDLPSPFGVYLHDTPSRTLFQKRNRALSHGCMRLEKPQELAQMLLGAQGWTEDGMDRAIEAKSTLRVDLETHTPLYVMYWTAVADAGGQVDFRPDVYDWDRKLTDALASRTVVSLAGPSATDCAAASPF
jgi:murein L,D-transpeptidase YcbB/YkuD